MRIDCQPHIYPYPAFNAIKVRKIEPFCEAEDVIYYNNMTAKLKTPMPIIEGLKKLLDSVYKNINNKIAQYTCLESQDVPKIRMGIENINPNHFENRKLIGVVGSGVNNLALQLDNNEVLCITNDLSIFDRRPFEDFDLPILKREDFKLYVSRGWFIRKLGQPVNKRELNKLARKIELKGYSLVDWRTEQACKIDGKVYLVDFECAQRDY